MSKKVGFKTLFVAIIVATMMATMLPATPFAVKETEPAIAETDITKYEVKLTKFKWLGGHFGTYTHQAVVMAQWTRNTGERGAAYASIYQYQFYGTFDDGYHSTLETDREDGYYRQDEGDISWTSLYVIDACWSKDGTSSAGDGIYLWVKLQLWGMWLGQWINEGAYTHYIPRFFVDQSSNYQGELYVSVGSKQAWIYYEVNVISD